MNLANIIEPHDGSRVAFRFRGQDVSYDELRRRCGALRSALTERGIVAGDRVALLLGATPDFAAAYLGTLGIGAVAVPLNPNSPAPEVDRELRAVGALLVLVGGDAREELSDDLRGIGHDVFSLPADDPAGEAPPVADRSPDDEAVLLFTSGTAGSPKAAILTHGNLLSNIEQVEMRVGLAATADDVGILAVPPFHILGLNAVLGVQLYAGGKLVLLERFDAEEMLEAICTEQVTILAGVPQLFAALADFEQASGKELTSVRLACSGAAPLAASTAERFEARYGIPIWQGYGLTEASPTVSFPDLNEPRQVASVGVPLPGVEVRVVDEDGHDVEAGDPGEILVRGPNVFAGYFADNAATRAALDRQGWLHTGDVAVMSESGTITIVDRQKDLVIVSGFNVFPAEVEQVLEAHQLVAEAAVIGVPDEDGGESVQAFVVPLASSWPAGAAEPESLTVEALVRHCGEHLARYKCPSTIRFVRELPRGVQGKVLRRAVG